MSPVRKNRRTEGSRNAETQYRKAPGGCRESCFDSQCRAAGKKAAVTRKHRAPGRKAAATRTRRAATRKGAPTRARKKEEAAPTQPAQVQEPPAPEPPVQATPETSIPE